MAERPKRTPAAHNRRRPDGYIGGDGRALLSDARAARGYAHELRARARGGEDVSDEVTQEMVDLCFRSEALFRAASDLQFYGFSEAMTLDGVTLMILMGLTRPAGYYSRSPIGRMHSPASANAARILSDGAGDPAIPSVEILGSLEAQRAAYRRAARRLHPDVGGDTEAFQHLERANRHLIRRRRGVDHG